MKFKFYIVAAIAALSMPASAHHSHVNYQMTEYTHLEGTVTEFIFMNPHSWVYMSVAGDDGEATIWALETGSVRDTTMTRTGTWSAAAGPRIKIRISRQYFGIGLRRN